jgi:TolB protein
MIRIVKRVMTHAAVAIGLSLVLASGALASERIYIDIIKAPRKLPIAVMDLVGPHGGEVADVIRFDLEFSGLFAPIDEAAFVESPSEPFRQSNWAGTGAEAVVKGTISQDAKLTLLISLHDVFDGSLVMQRKYSADPSLLRPLAHTVANDIYKHITGQAGVFRTKIAFVSVKGNRQQLYLADWDGSRPRALGVAANALMTPHWSPNGTSLLYSAQRGRSWSIYLLSFERRKEEKVFYADGVNLAGDFLPDGKTFLLSSSRKGTPDIYSFRIPGKKLVRLTSDRGIEVSPSASTDGASIAYVSDRGGTPQIYTMDNFGYNKTRVTFEGNYNTSPVWSPQGDLLAFSGRYKGRNQIFVIRPDGSDPRVLTDRGNNEEPTFSPDGRLLAFTSDRDGHKAVYIMRINGEGQMRISPRGSRASGPRWSPN